MIRIWIKVILSSCNRMAKVPEVNQLGLIIGVLSEEYHGRQVGKHGFQAGGKGRP